MTSDDASALEAVYKLAGYGGAGRVKLSHAKDTLPGAKQVFRSSEGDVIGLAGEALPGEPLLRPVMHGANGSRRARERSMRHGTARARNARRCRPESATSNPPLLRTR